MPTLRPLIPLPDYQRIFRVVKTVLDGIDSDPSHSCIFFSVAGAAILRKFYKTECSPVAGAAFYVIDGENRDVLTFAKIDDGNPVSSEDAFHCWVQTKDYIIDFMAPLFVESMQAVGFTSTCSRKMFQKHKHTMALAHTELRKSGDFYMKPDIDLTNEILKRFFSRRDTTDLVEVCLQRYKKPPKEMLSRLTMGVSDSQDINMKLTGLTVNGAW
jgi:hypothetical protein